MWNATPVTLSPAMLAALRSSGTSLRRAPYLRPKQNRAPVSSSGLIRMINSQFG
ncbi:hypothetical protein A2U01_0092298, partial [Trifolium medium]|nr:hypothetical protein [Trifolium medium]